MDRAVSTHVSGSPEGGFIVDLHDGARHMSHVSQAPTAEDAEREGVDAFDAFAQADEGPAPGTADVSDLRDEIELLKMTVDDLKEGVQQLQDQVSALRASSERMHQKAGEQAAPAQQNSQSDPEDQSDEDLGTGLD